jgi:hypothetical protein
VENTKVVTDDDELSSFGRRTSIKHKSGGSIIESDGVSSFEKLAWLKDQLHI